MNIDRKGKVVLVKRKIRIGVKKNVAWYLL